MQILLLYAAFAGSLEQPRLNILKKLLRSFWLTLSFLPLLNNLLPAEEVMTCKATWSDESDESKLFLLATLDNRLLALNILRARLIV